LWIFYSIRNIKSIYKEFEIMSAPTPSVGVFEYVAGEPGQCNVIVRAHVSPETVLGKSKTDLTNEHYMVPPNVPVFSTSEAMKNVLNANGKRSRSGGSEGIPIVAHVTNKELSADGKVNSHDLVFVGVSVGSTMAGKEGPSNGRCVSIAVSGAMTIPKAEAANSANENITNFSFGQELSFVFGQKYGSTPLHIAMPCTENSGTATVAGTTSVPIIGTNGRAIRAITTSPRDVRIHMH
jgi:hypothetical protein